MASDKVLKITKNNFDTDVLNSKVPVLVDLWAPWCGPCRAIAPLIEELANEYDGKAKIGKINVDEQPELATQFRVMSIPTILLFSEGAVKERIIGARPKQELVSLISKYL